MIKVGQQDYLKNSSLTSTGGNIKENINFTLQTGNWLIPLHFNQINNLGG